MLHSVGELSFFPEEKKMSITFFHFEQEKENEKKWYKKNNLKLWFHASMNIAFYFY